jgi:SAM-dependent methyltransferase
MIGGARFDVVALHHAAETGYNLAAADYERVRPSYPTRALSVLADALDLKSGQRVADLGAGTGKFTRLLALTGAKVVAVEPVAAMRERLTEILPQVQAVAGAAEATGLPDASVDAVVAAQAWHWFDGPAALTEIERITGPYGRLGLVWNTLDASVPWVAEYSRIYQAWRTDELPVHTDGSWRATFEGRRGWKPLNSAYVANPYVTDREGVLGQALTSSRISTLGNAEREEIRANCSRCSTGTRRRAAADRDPLRHRRLLDRQALSTGGVARYPSRARRR